jgi:hypothetical protein
VEAVNTTARFVRVPGIGGFSTDSLAFWKMNSVVTAEGTKQIVSVYFKTGGFIDLPGDIDEAQFTSLVYGEPF